MCEFVVTLDTLKHTTFLDSRVEACCFSFCNVLTWKVCLLPGTPLLMSSIGLVELVNFEYRHHPSPILRALTSFSCHNLTEPCEPHVLQHFVWTVTVRVAWIGTAELVAGVMTFSASGFQVSNDHLTSTICLHFLSLLFVLTRSQLCC